MSIKKRFLSFPTMGAMGMVVVGREMSDSIPFCQIQANRFITSARRGRSSASPSSSSAFVNTRCSLPSSAYSFTFQNILPTYFRQTAHHDAQAATTQVHHGRSFRLRWMALCPVLWRQGRSGRHHWGCVVFFDAAPIVHLSPYLILRSARSRYHLRRRVWLYRQLSCYRGQGWSRRPFWTERNGPYLSPPRRWVRQALLMCLISPVSLLSACSVPAQKKGCEYKFYTEFQSHEPEFDYLKSLEIEEKINKIKWCKRQNQAHFLLSTNGALSDFPRPFHNYTTTTPRRQNNQTLESLWKVASYCFWIKSSWWCPPSTSSTEPVTSTTSSDGPPREHHCCCTP